MNLVPSSLRHTLLVRQLKRLFGGPAGIPKSCEPLIAIVNETYDQADVDRRMLERSLELSSEELGEANNNLRRVVLELQAAHRDMEARVQERTRALEVANESLRQAQKMEAIGALAGGIAHDFNNLLTVIGGCTDLLLKARASQDPDQIELEEIRLATQRAAALTQQLLAFGRKQVMTPEVIDLNGAVLHMQRLLSRLVREDISLVADPAARPAWVRLDPNQIEQVLLNLVLNARDALPHGGRIRLAVAHEGGDVRLTVSDNGVGMSADVCARAFEPFFTTKGSHGTGLGLASAHGIVHQSNGCITVESTEGAGTTFTMRFPAARIEIAAVSGRNGTGTVAESVLLVEDEARVRRVLRTMLERGGFHVTEAATPLEACALFEDPESHIDVLVTDVIMPGMNGPALAKRLLETAPDLPVLFISGHSNIDSDLLKLDNPRISFLTKPVLASQLTTRVRELLARKDIHMTTRLHALRSATLILLAMGIVLIPARPQAQLQVVRTADPYKRGYSDADFPRVQKLADGVFSYEQLRSAGNEKFTTVSLFVVTSAGVLVADGQGSTEETKRMLDVIATVTPQPVTHLVIGSDHGDHTAGNAAFPARIKVFAHPVSKAILEKGTPAIAAGATTPVEKELSLTLGSTEIRIVFLGRAHTGGDLSVYLPREKILFMSEAFLHRVFPAMRSAYPSEWVAAIAKAQAMDVTLFVPGHGFVESATILKEELEAARQALVQVIAEGKRLHAAGVPVDEAVTRASFGNLETWTLRSSQGPTAIRRVYLELDGKLR